MDLTIPLWLFGGGVLLALAVIGASVFVVIYSRDREG
jgi:hypothetical protein